MSHPAPARASSRGFTLVELLTVVAIIGILAAILLPTINHIRESARATKDLASMRGLGQAMLQYAAENKGMINMWGYEAGKPLSLDNSFWGRAWPYLNNTQLKPLSSENMKAVANDYISSAIADKRPELIANNDGINYTIALNRRLSAEGATIPNSALRYTQFSRVQSVPNPAGAPYMAIGFYGIYNLIPKPLSESKRAEEGAYFPYNGDKTIVVMVDGSASLWGDTMTGTVLTSRSR